MGFNFDTYYALSPPVLIRHLLQVYENENENEGPPAKGRGEEPQPTTDVWVPLVDVKRETAEDYEEDAIGIGSHRNSLRAEVNLDVFDDME